MEFNRNHYFMIGLVVLALGLQLRYVESFVLTEQATQVANKVLKPAASAETASLTSLFIPSSVAPRQVVRPPAWLGAVFISAGVVLVLWSLAMQKPGG